ncbi:MAG: outer membrane beta-barrel protein [Saprospiraceae bacterium]|nr:outer membrane beta-barrel protein [Saprospiraceae bacterium]
MRVLFFILFMAPFLIHGQDSTMLEFEDWCIETERDFAKTRYGLVDFGVSGLISDDNYRLENGIDPFEMRPLKSTNIKLHLFQQRLKLVKGYVSLGYGIVLDFNKYYFDNPVVLLEDQPQVAFDFRPDAGFKKNRLSYWVLDIPFMLHFESNPKNASKSLHLSGGAYAGMLLGANFKTKSKGQKNKTRDNFGIDRWRFGLRAEIGYGPVTLYGTYDLNALFEEEKNGGYKVTPFSLGFMLWPF